MRERPCVLTIAGSDPSGGAGAQADLRVFEALGVTGLSAITALTVQNSQGVRSVHPVAAAVLAEQLKCLFEDFPVRAVKIGMLAGAEQVRAVAAALRDFQPPNVILDPVLASTGGFPLLDADGRAALVDSLLPLSDLITPNLAELEALSGRPISAGADRIGAAAALISRAAGAVLVKGGHLQGAPIDMLVRPIDLIAADPSASVRRYFARRVDTPHTHGTGCALSAAVAAYLALGGGLEDTIKRAKELLTSALLLPTSPGHGRGWPDVTAAAASPRDADRSASAEAMRNLEARLFALTGGLYVITDSRLRPDRPVEEVAAQAIAGGATTIQLRDKSLSTIDLVAAARRLVAICHAAGALLIVNDRVDVAAAADADGVHLGPDDMHPADAQHILGPDRLIGVSTGTVAEAIAAAPYASYLGVGAIFGSATKLDAGDAVGPGRIAEISAALGDGCPPIVAIGGITVENIAEVARAGADAAAVVSAVAGADDVLASTRALFDQFIAAVAV